MPEYGLNSNTINLQHLQLKFATAANWSASTVLLAGEVGVETDTHKMKVGDGTTTWENLPYSSDPTLAGLITALTGRVTTAEGDIDAVEGRMETAESDIDALEAKDVVHESRMTTIEAKDTAQDGRLDALEGITIISANPFSA